MATSATDVNGKTSSTGFNDANYWRPTSVTDTTGAITALTYFTAPNSGTESTLNFDGTVSTTGIHALR